MQFAASAQAEEKLAAPVAELRQDPWPVFRGRQVQALTKSRGLPAPLVELSAKAMQMVAAARPAVPPEAEFELQMVPEAESAVPPEAEFELQVVPEAEPAVPPEAKPEAQVDVRSAHLPEVLLAPPEALLVKAELVVQPKVRQVSGHLTVLPHLLVLPSVEERGAQVQQLDLPLPHQFAPYRLEQPDRQGAV